jgi:hypothetical protein
MSKMKKGYLFLGFTMALMMVFLTSAALGMGGPPPEKDVSEKAEGAYLIDDFESGSLNTRGWWTFDIQNAEIYQNSDLSLRGGKVAEDVGQYSLWLEGEAKNWYAGGCGAYIAKENLNLSVYNSLQLDIYGNGVGNIKIELADDDNNNWQNEQDPDKAYASIYDDKYVYQINVDWRGWQRVTIPFDDFVDDNPGVGDDIWNIEQKDGSGGLLQIQFICLASRDTGMVNYNLDNISLSVSEE